MDVTLQMHLSLIVTDADGKPVINVVTPRFPIEADRVKLADWIRENADDIAAEVSFTLAKAYA